MAETPAWRYYAAVLASLVSSLGWLGAVGGLGLVAYTALTGGAVRELSAAAVLALLVVGIVFARVEKLLYRRDE
jgi:hypothetical protein